MDIEKNVRETVPAPADCGFPSQDYNEKGELKPIRARIVKKLLKYEFRAIFPIIFIVLGLLAGATAVMNIVYPIDTSEQIVELQLPKFFITLTYIFAVIATPAVAVGVSVERYRKNFFKSEGYLTFSIPASMEEHVFAKHLSGMVATLIAIVASFISALITTLMLSEISFDGEVGDSVVSSPLSIALEIFEYLILFFEGLICVFSVSGALTCWGQRFEKKTKIIVWALLAYVTYTALETVFWVLVDYGAFRFFFTEIGGHVGRWIGITLLAAAMVLSVWYELRFLKKNLNLK